VRRDAATGRASLFNAPHSMSRPYILFLLVKPLSAAAFRFKLLYTQVQACVRGGEHTNRVSSPPTFDLTLLQYDSPEKICIFAYSKKNSYV